MSILVQKFGGTSLQDKETRLYAIEHVQSAVREGYQVVVVVSAMGRSPSPYATDSLLALLGESRKISEKEEDLLLSCGEILSSVVFSNELQHQNLQSIAITGAKAGMITTNDFTNAKIKTIQQHNIQQLLKEYQVVVVAGFQGQTEDGEVTTIGRGGSDTSAVALGVALQADYVDIFTDVEGIMTADPQMVSSAQKRTEMSYTEICHLAYQGAKVIHPRAVELAMQENLLLRVRSTKSNDFGTLIISDEHMKKKSYDRLITGIAYMKDVVQIKIEESKEPQQIHVNVFRAMAEAGISVDFINISPNGVVYTILSKYEQLAVRILTQLDLRPTVRRNCAKVSIVGAGMSGVPGVTSKIVQSLTDENIPILQSADSHTTIWVLIEQQYLEKAVNVLHHTFRLDE